MKTIKDINTIEIVAKAEGIIQSSEALKESIAKIHEYNSIFKIIMNIVEVTDFVINLVLTIEVAVNNLIDTVFHIKSSEKLDAAVAIFDKYIRLPWYFEILDDFALRILISVVVTIMNKWFGVKWDLLLARESLATGQDYIDLVRGD